MTLLQVQETIQNIVELNHTSASLLRTITTQQPEDAQHYIDYYTKKLEHFVTEIQRITQKK